MQVKIVTQKIGKYDLGSQYFDAIRKTVENIL